MHFIELLHLYMLLANISILTYAYDGKMVPFSEPSVYL